MTDGNWIKIALQVKQKTHLTKLNIDLNVEEILKEICSENDIPYRRGLFALKVQDFCKIVGTEYVTEENKSELKHGRQLKLSKSPAERAGILIDLLHKSKDAESSLKNLKSLARASRDAVMLQELYRQNALQHLRVFASVRSLSEDEYYRFYRVIGQFLARDYVKQLCEDEVDYLVDLITCDKKITREMLLLAFELLILLQKRGALRWPMKYLRRLTPYLRLWEEAKLQERTLQLINCLYLYGSDAEERETVQNFMKSPIMLTYINKYIIRGYLTSSMKHQLYLYQKIILRKYNKQLEPVDLNEEKIVENLQYVISNIGLVNQVRQMRISAEMRKSEERGEEDRTQQTRIFRLSSISMGRQRTASTPTTPEPEEPRFRDQLRSQDSDAETEFLNRKIEVRNLSREMSEESVGVDLSEEEGEADRKVTTAGLLESRGCEYCNPKEVPSLARDNLYYFIINDFRSFESLVVMHKDQLKSILHLSVGITNLLCRIFEIQEEEPEIKKGRFVPLCFLYYDYVIERIFCVALRLFHNTRREMNVSIDSCEFPVVLKTLEDQLTLALEAEPVEFLELEKRLAELTVEVIIQKREELIREDMKKQLIREPAFIELKDIVTPRILEKIKEKRLRFMERGEHVPQYDLKGQRIGGKKLFVFITKVHDRVNLEECSSNPCRGHHKPIETVSVSDIREVEYGNKSNFYKEVYYNLNLERDMFFRPGSRQQEPEMKHPVSLKLHGLNYVDFSAGSEMNMDYWVDGLRYLTGEKMNSKSMTEEFNYLLDIELMTHLADLEGVKLPDKPPAVPPPPSDYNFVTP